MRTWLAACAFIGGCAAVPPPAEAPPGPGEILSAAAALETLSIGKSTRADVRARLGKATVIDFESGYEVWVYRERPRPKAPPPAPELVLLFAPSGILAKARIR
jgi:hypothetical protein